MGKLFKKFLRVDFLIRPLLIFQIFLIAGCSVDTPQLATPAEWYPFDPDSLHQESLISMADWLESPAGLHGHVKMDGERFVFEDNTPVKFWGVNIASNKPYSEKDEADKWTDYLANFGVNAVRFHKFSSHGMPKDASTVLSDEKWDRLDYFHFRLKEAGLYVGWSHIYGHKPRPDDRDKLMAYDEVNLLFS